MLVHVQLFDLRRDHADPACVPPDEHARAARFLREEDRQRYLLGRTVVRRLCAAHLACHAAEVQLLQHGHGKPYILTPPGTEPLEFNLTHSGEVVALAWSIGATAGLGIDVEIIERHRTPDFHGIARTVFSPAEREVLAHSSGAELAATFYKIWVRKEAIVKAEGCGIAAGAALQQFTVATLAPDGAVEWPGLVDFPGGRRWKLLPIPAPSSYKAALAIPPASVVELRP